MQKITLSTFKNYKKNTQKIVAITAYDALMAGIFDEYADMILVGDSLHMSFNASSDTLGISVDSMIYHTQAVCAGAKRALIVADMPFGSYYNTDEALKNALKFYTQTRCDALKLEVNADKLGIIESLVKEGFAIMPHIGLKPQSVRGEGGYKIKGKDEKEARELIDLAKELERVGAFGILLEGVKSEVAATITQQVNVPVIGIGSGVECDGQILVWSDVFGFFNEFKPKFVRYYANGREFLSQAMKHYADDVRSKVFPNDEESY